MDDGALKNILIIGFGMHLITRDNLIEAGFKVEEIPREDFYLNLDVKNDVEFNLLGIDVSERPTTFQNIIIDNLFPDDYMPTFDEPVKPKVSKPWYRQNEKY